MKLTCLSNNNSVTTEVSYGFNPLAWNNFGVALVGSQQYEEALNAFEQALALNPTLAIARMNANCVRSLLGHQFQETSDAA
ncbi:tetratricopeptide repeat protein [Oscillatoriales cyanobacterium LEGE 11467]|uniref:Tetratricopeptide repeat protein n=1 Tax=Zarconia navalis LEGE 11467 TaxID=1828826 RepID=A0A928Z827_9CYAN|nr:tetratricopeptide repeat protein [Zarconia navalis]MBE9040104.1 tetratricopeptide repeat protein [Zarconia navalis LEGE 11467]